MAYPLSYGAQRPESYTVTIDYEQLIWEALRLCNVAFQSPVYESRELHTKAAGFSSSESKVDLKRYENEVLKLLNYILPDWVVEDNQGWEKRFAEWSGQFSTWQRRMKEWQALHDTWEYEKGDLLHEPIQPAKPPDRPLPFSVEVDSCYNEKDGWLPFKLHKAILRLLHRRNFFKRTEEMEVIEGTLEQAEPEPSATSGSATT